MTKFSSPVRRETLQTYRHYRRTIIISLYADTISLRLKGTRTAYEIPVSHLMDDLCRREARRLQLEKARRRKAPIR
jgi:hypothetical protein